MKNERLTASESHELASIVHSVGAKNVLNILRNAVNPKKQKRIHKFQKLPTDIRAKVAVMLSSGRYSQKEMLDYVNAEVENRGLNIKFKISRTSFNNFLNKIVYPALPS
ncbi:DUF3486 family protein [Acinetobacter oleivorans]|uniref:DUF3486 family protein n=1 Tax=Acinetobacter oleivorans TaxID=1148157 RepID=UPI00178CB544|nr:DUF3486 family protein [Acinetobacter oleivorans]MBE2174162.1 DUF3486 family protein [Acinetobacter oleivorans]